MRKSALLSVAVLLAASLFALSCGGEKIVKAGPDPVYVNKTGVNYHYAGCRSLVRSMRPIPLEDAKAQGYIPCEKCDFMRD